MSQHYMAVLELEQMKERADEAISLGSLPVAEQIASALQDRGYPQYAEEIFRATRFIRQQRHQEDWAYDEWRDNELVSA